jgi:hypothetical protein
VTKKLTTPHRSERKDNESPVFDPEAEIYGNLADAAEDKGVWATSVERMSAVCSQWSLAEISGGFGDLGTLLPFLAALAKEDPHSTWPSAVFRWCF